VKAEGEVFVDKQERSEEIKEDPASKFEKLVASAVEQIVDIKTEAALKLDSQAIAFKKDLDRHKPVPGRIYQPSLAEIVLADSLSAKVRA
jgi:hypothetical protein